MRRQHNGDLRLSSCAHCICFVFSGEIVAVLQVINKNGNGDEGFTQVDETLIENLSSHVGVTLRNAQYYQQAASSRRQVRARVHIRSSIPTIRKR